MLKPIAELAADLAEGRATAESLVDSALARIADPKGEGATTFLKVHGAAARAQAQALDRLRKLGQAPSPFAGIPISIKDLFDLKGDVSLAGSKVLADRPPAKADAPAVARLKAAGFIVMGRTNMTEFAYSGLGLNPHYGTPKNPHDRKTGRIPGGSSSGAAISVTDGMAAAGLGTDTGGSCRIPAALCGLVGWKPTASRVSRQGVIPLSNSLDSVGVLARTVDCVATLDAIAAGDEPPSSTSFPLSGLRLAVPQAVVLDGMDEAVAKAFADSCARLSKAGAKITDLPLNELKELGAINAKGGFAAAEAYGWHRKLMAAKGADYDPRVRVRIEKGAGQDAADYLDLLAARAEFINRVRAISAPFDALLLPTVPRVAPSFAELESDDDYGRINLLMLRNPAVINFLDGCAISLPAPVERGALPVGIMLAGFRNEDRRLFALARSLEHLFTVGK
ncbi:MAG: amidase [Rhodospirillales bacterium]|nr:amidase [Rhodospirillales bacterium]